MNSSNKPKWENPQESIGKQITSTRTKTVWEASGPALELFEQKIFYAIEEALNLNKEHLDSEEESSHTVSFHLWMIGRKPENARPTVIFTSKSAPLRAKVVKVIKKDRVLADFPGVTLKSMNRMPAAPMGNDLKSCQGDTTFGNRSSITSTVSLLTDDTMLQVEAYESDQICGMPLLIGGKYEATLGGILVFNDMLFGFTVVHSSQHQIDDIAESHHASGAMVTFDQTSDSTDSRSSLHQSCTSGSSTAQSISSGRESTMSEQDKITSKGEEELSQSSSKHKGPMFTLGEIHRSEESRSLDYRLFRIDDPRYYTINRISSPIDTPGAHTEICPQTIAAYPLEREVLLATAKSGTLQGVLLTNSYYIKMAGSNHYQKMWPVQLNAKIVPGDCGAWVVDAQTGQLYGHVVAGNPALNRAYIIPAIEVFRDIQRTCGGRVALPRSFEGIPQGETQARRNYSEAVAAYGQRHHAWNIQHFASSLNVSISSVPSKKGLPIMRRYDLQSECDCGPHSYENPSEFLLDADLFGYGQDTSSVVFLNGELTPDWISALGSTYLLDPAFFVNHLEIEQLRSSKSIFQLPELPSSNHITLNYTTIGTIDSTLDGAKFDENLIKGAVKGNGGSQYLERLDNARRSGSGLESGTPRFRHFSVHQDGFCSLEQKVSIQLQQSRVGWIVLVWFDGGWAFDQDNPIPGLGIPGRPQSFIRHASWLTSAHGNTASATSNRMISEGPHLLQLRYGSGIDKTLAVQDPFYALTDVLNFIAQSEHQFLNLMDSISHDSITKPDYSDPQLGLRDVVHNKSILERHVRYIKECISLVQSRGGPDWNPSPEQISKKATVAAQKLSADFEFLLKCAQRLVSSYNDHIQIIMRQATIRESCSAIQQAETIQRLTWLAFLFLPLSFVTSFYGMNLVEFGVGTKHLRQWFATALPILLFSLVFLYAVSNYSEIFSRMRSRLSTQSRRTKDSKSKADPVRLKPSSRGGAAATASTSEAYKWPREMRSEISRFPSEPFSELPSSDPFSGLEKGFP